MAGKRGKRGASDAEMKKDERGEWRDERARDEQGRTGM